MAVIGSLEVAAELPTSSSSPDLGDMEMSFPGLASAVLLCPLSWLWWLGPLLEIGFSGIGKALSSTTSHLG